MHKLNSKNTSLKSIGILNSANDLKKKSSADLLVFKYFPFLLL